MTDEINPFGKDNVVELFPKTPSGEMKFHVSTDINNRTPYSLIIINDDDDGVVACRFNEESFQKLINTLIEMLSSRNY